MSYRIHLVEDDANLNVILSTYLSREGWQVSSFFTGAEALQAIGLEPHLWILDIMLPDINGYHLLQEIKNSSPHIPVIFISARDANIDRVVGLELGSDDYLAKPFLPRELIIRVGKILARVETTPAASRDIPPYTVYLQSRTVTWDQGAIELTAREFDLLVYLLNHVGQALTREQILLHIWGQDYYGSDRVVDDLVRRLRRKMPCLRIETLYSYGYRMVQI